MYTEQRMLIILDIPRYAFSMPQVMYEFCLLAWLHKSKDMTVTVVNDGKIFCLWLSY